MKCPQCGVENEETWSFCTNCGAPLEPATPGPSVATPPPPPAQVLCPSCRASNLEGSVFCNKCGSRLTEEASGIPYLLEKKETSWAWWLMPVFLWWVGGLIAWLAVKRDDPAKARRLLWLGIGLTILWIIFIAATAS